MEGIAFNVSMKVPVMEKAVVTGGLGFIGSRISSQLHEDGYEVTILDNAPSAAPKEMSLERASITEYSSVYRALKDAKLIFHEAALVSVPLSIEQPALAREINVKGTLNVLRAARENGAKRVVLASSSAVYGNSAPPLKESMKPSPLSPYAETKLENEQQAAEFWKKEGLEAVCLRYFNVYGPGQRADSPYSAVIPRFISALKSGSRPVIYGDGKQTRDFIYVEDVVRANLLASKSGRGTLGKAFNVASGRPTSLISLLDSLSGLMRKKPQIDFQPARKGDIRHSYADVSLAQKELGFSPKWDLRKGLSETLHSLEPIT
jgi:nucleoside-diphosphate-sugar epimerase